MAATIPGAGITTPLTLTEDGNLDTLTLKSTDADASSGPNIVLNRDSSSPADNDIVGQLTFRADNDAGEATDYCRMRTHLQDVSDGTEDGNFRLFTLVGGSELSRISVASEETIFNEDSGDIDFRVESNGHTGALFVSGEYDHHVAIGATSITAPSTGEVLSVGHAHIVSLDANDAGYQLANMYYNQSDGNWKFQTTNRYATLMVQHTVLPNAFELWTADAGGTPSAGDNVTLNQRFKMTTDGTLTATDTSIGAISDQRLKENIQDYTYDVAKFKQFKPRTFDWKHPEAHTNEETTGFVAQEVESVDSDWVYEDTWADDVHKGKHQDEEKALCNNENKKAAKLSKKDAMYISVIQQLITRIEALESA